MSCMIVKVEMVSQLHTLWASINEQKILFLNVCLNINHAMHLAEQKQSYFRIHAFSLDWSQLCPLPVSFDICFQLLLWASYQTGKVAGCACTKNDRNVFPTNFKGDRYLTIPACITERAWRMSGSLNLVAGKTFPAFPVHAQLAMLCI